MTRSGAPWMFFFRDDRGALVRDEDQVWLGNVLPREQHVDRGSEDLTEPSFLTKSGRAVASSRDTILCRVRGRRRHVVLSVEDLVALPVLRKRTYPDR